MSQPPTNSLLLRPRSRARLRQTLHRVGGFKLWRHWKAGRSLTVLLLHRVVRDEEMGGPGADPATWMPASLFEAALAHLSGQYGFIGLPQLLAWIDERKPLPAKPLLVTFDDGWADTAAIALPILQRAGLPAALFVATDALMDPDPVWWQEAARREPKQGPGEALDGLCALAHDPSALQVLRSGGFTGATPRPRDMLRPDELVALLRSGIAVGAHSAAHLPLTRLADEQIAQDLDRSRRALSAWLIEDPTARSVALRCLAFPHGRWDERVAAQARKAGFDVLFSSEPSLNPLVWPPTLPFGRISLTANAIAAPDGRLAPDRLASWLLARKTRAAAIRP
jgi:peptidoglycan/xylan/chitin deacetylase (PgdA/CDA1 family)